MLLMAAAATKLVECLNPKHHLHHNYLTGMLNELLEEPLQAQLNGSILVHPALRITGTDFCYLPPAWRSP